MNAGHITVGIERHFQGARHAVLDVVGVYRNIAVLGTGNRILVAVFAGVFVVFRTGGVGTFEFLNGIDGNFRFVVTNPSQHAAVG